MNERSSASHLRSRVTASRSFLSCGMAGAGRVLPVGGVLYLYGPFQENDRHTAPSNAAFHASLRARNSEWGVRDLGEVAALAMSYCLS
jgi:hypothetical protein